jgi:hypothetical protein
MTDGKVSVRTRTDIKMSASPISGGLETMGVDLDSGDTPMTEEAAGSGKKHKKSAPVPPDEFDGDRIKLLKTRITGLKSGDNAWTQTLRDKLDPDTVNGKLTGDRVFKTNQLVAPTHGGSKEAAPKWSWYGVLFMLAPFGMLSGKQDSIPPCGFVLVPKDTAKSTRKLRCKLRC